MIGDGRRAETTLGLFIEREHGAVFTRIGDVSCTAAAGGEAAGRHTCLWLERLREGVWGRGAAHVACATDTGVLVGGRRGWVGFFDLKGAAHTCFGS